MDVQAGTVGERLQERRDDVALEPADALARKVDIRGEERMLGDLQDRAGEGLSRQYAHPRPEARGARTRPASAVPMPRPAATTLVGLPGDVDDQLDPQRAARRRGSSTDSLVETLARPSAASPRARLRLAHYRLRAGSTDDVAARVDPLDRGAQAAVRRSARSRGRSGRCC
jgi:hypothetical protein